MFRKPLTVENAVNTVLTNFNKEAQNPSPNEHHYGWIMVPIHAARLLDLLSENLEYRAGVAIEVVRNVMLSAKSTIQVTVTHERFLTLVANDHVIVFARKAMAEAV